MTSPIEQEMILRVALEEHVQAPLNAIREQLSGLGRASGEAAVGADRASRTHSAFESTLGHLGSAVGYTLGRLRNYASFLVGPALLGGVVLATKNTINFEAAMTRLNTQANAKLNLKDMAALKNQVLDLAGAVGEDPNSLAMGLYHLESAGFRTGQAMDLLRVAAEGARIGNADLADTTQAMIALTASQITGFTGAAGAMGVLNATVGTGDTTMQRLVKSLQTGIAPTFAQAGLTAQDLGASIATITDNATPAEVAATRLRTTISMAVAPSGAAIKALKDMGIGANDLARDMRQPNGLLVMVGDLRSHMLAMKDPIRADQDLLAAFGKSRTAGSISTLVTEFDRLRMKYADIEKADPAKQLAAAWAETQRTTSQHVAQLRATFDALGIRVGEYLLPYVSRLSDWLSKEAPQAVSAAGGALSRLRPYFDRIGDDLTHIFRDLGPIFQQIVLPILQGLAGALGGVFIVALHAVRDVFDVIAAHARVLGPIITGLLAGFLAFRLVTGVIGAFTALRAAIQGISLAITANPAVLIIAAVVGLGVAIFEAYKHIKGFHDFIDGAWRDIRRWSTDLWQALEQVGRNIGHAFGNVTHAIGDVVTWLREHWTLVLDILAGPFGLAIGAIITHWHTVERVLHVGFQVISTIFRTIIALVMVPWILAWQGLVATWQNIWDMIGGTVKRAWSIISGAVRAGWSAVTGWLAAQWARFTGWWNVGWSWVSRIVSDRWRTFVRDVQITWAILTSWLASGWRTFSGWWNAGWSWVSRIVSDRWHTFVHNVQVVWAVLMGWWNAVWQPFARGWDAGWSHVRDAFLGVWHAIQSGFSTAATAIGRVWDQLKGQAAKPVNFIIDTVWNNGLARAWNTAADLVHLPHAPHVDPIKFAVGGHVPGQGSGDTVPALLTPGEFVLTREAVRNVGVDTLAAINAGNRAHFQGGGLVGTLERAVGSAVSAVTSTVGGLFEKGVTWVRGGLADAFNIVGGRVLTAADAALGTGHTLGGLVDRMAHAVVDRLGSFIRGHDVAPAPTPFTAGSFGGGTFGGLTAGGGSAGQQAWAYAQHFLGVPYVFGGESPGAFDCSGLTEFVWRALGINIPRIAAAQQQFGHPVATSAISPGDLVFFGRPAHHVGIADSPSLMIDAPHTGATVRFESGYQGWGDFAGAMRPYDIGGWLQPGVTAAVNATGRREAVMPEDIMTQAIRKELNVVPNNAGMTIMPGGVSVTVLNPQTDMDISTAVTRGIQEYMRDQQERR